MDSAIVNAIRIAAGDPALTVVAKRGPVGWTPARLVEYRIASIARAGLDDERVTAIEGTDDVRETVRGVRVYSVEIVCYTASHDVTASALDLAEAIAIGLQSEEATEALDAANLGLGTISDVVEIPLLGRLADFESCASITVALHATRERVGRLVPFVKQVILG